MWRGHLELLKFLIARAKTIRSKDQLTILQLRSTIFGTNSSNIRYGISFFAYDVEIMRQILMGIDGSITEEVTSHSKHKTRSVNFSDWAIAFMIYIKTITSLQPTDIMSYPYSRMAIPISFNYRKLTWTLKEIRVFFFLVHPWTETSFNKPRNCSRKSNVHMQERGFELWFHFITLIIHRNFRIFY